MPVGYSGKPLVKKSGIKEGFEYTFAEDYKNVFKYFEIALQRVIKINIPEVKDYKDSIVQTMEKIN